MYHYALSSMSSFYGFTCVYYFSLLILFSWTFRFIFFFPISSSSSNRSKTQLSFSISLLSSPLLLTANLYWIMMRFFVDNFLSDIFHTWHLCVHWLILAAFFKALKRERWFKFKLDKKRKRKAFNVQKKVLNKWTTSKRQDCAMKNARCRKNKHTWYECVHKK